MDKLDVLVIYGDDTALRLSQTARLAKTIQRVVVARFVQHDIPWDEGAQKEDGAEDAGTSGELDVVLDFSFPFLTA